MAGITGTGGRLRLECVADFTGIGNQQEAPGPYDLPLSAAGLDHRPIEPGLGAGYHLYPYGRGFVSLVAVVDWASRKVLAAKITITLETCHAVDVLQEALNRHGTPEIVNTDQGSQFTSAEFVQEVEDRGCRESMDGRGAWRDNVFVERLWKTVNYEEVYLHAYASVNEARESIKHSMGWYNRSQPHLQ